MRATARGELRAAVYEARIADDPDALGRVAVTARGLTGDTQRLGPFAGAQPIASGSGAGITLRLPTRGDRAWVALDEDGNPACIVAWEPAAI